MGVWDRGNISAEFNDTCALIGPNHINHQVLEIIRDLEKKGGLYDGFQITNRDGHTYTYTTNARGNPVWEIRGPLMERFGGCGTIQARGLADNQYHDTPNTQTANVDNTNLGGTDFKTFS